MARNRTRNQRKLRVDPVTEELRELLKETPPAVEVVTAGYEIQEVPETILDVSKLPPILDVSKLPLLEEQVVTPVVNSIPVTPKVEIPKYTDTSLKKLFDLIEQFCS